MPEPEHVQQPKTPNLALLYFRYRMGRYKSFWLLFAITFILDHLTKFIVVAFVPHSHFHPPIEVISGFFNIVHVYNEGAAFSILKGHGWFLILLALFALWAIYRWRHNLELRNPVVQITFGLLTGGIVGNQIDRLLRGHVVDFLDFDLPFFGIFAEKLLGWPPGSHWPAFNIADIGINLGVFIYLVSAIFSTKEASPDKEGKPKPLNEN